MSEPHPPLLLKPQYVPKPWGGRRLESELGRHDLPEGPIGESWDIVDTDDTCSVVEFGVHTGKTLREVLGTPFPLLIKVLDAQADLSVQVHPAEEDEASAKEEAWVALADGGKVAVGLRPDVDPAVAPADGAWLESLETRELLTGEGELPPSLIHVPPGTVHAVLAGALVWEVQNPVDVTWRLDDYGRKGIDGNPRALHREQARDVLARGPEASGRCAADKSALFGRRITVRLVPPGRMHDIDGLAAFFTQSGILHWGPDELAFEVPAGRTVVLPSQVAWIESHGWVFVADVPGDSVAS